MNTNTLNSEVDNSPVQVAAHKATGTVETEQVRLFGNGAYSKMAYDFYCNAGKRFQIPAKSLLVIAKQFVSDIGAFMAKQDRSVKLGKLTKDGKLNMREIVKAKGCTATKPMMLGRALEWMDEAESNGISYGKTEWKLSQLCSADGENDSLQDYVNEVIDKTENKP